MAQNHVYGDREVISLFEQVKQAPVKVLTQSAKSGASIALNYVKAHVYDGFNQRTGNIKKGLKLKLEKRKKGKRVYHIGGKSGSVGWKVVFMDYGFTDRAGRYHPGNRCMRDAIDRNRELIRTTMLDKIGTELDKLR